MEARAVPSAPELTPSGTTARLVVSIVVAPLLWLVHLVASFALVRFACSSNAAWLLHGISAVALALAATATWVGWSEWSGRGPARPGAPDRSRFLAAIGAGSSALFSAIIALSWIASFVIEPCDLV